MKRKKTVNDNGDRTNKYFTTETGKDKQTFSYARQFCTNSITYADIPLRSVYYRLFEGLENQIVPFNTPSIYQQISMLSPQTPRNIRICKRNILKRCLLIWKNGRPGGYFFYERLLSLLLG